MKKLFRGSGIQEGMFLSTQLPDFVEDLKVIFFHIGKKKIL